MSKIKYLLVGLLCAGIARAQNPERIYASAVKDQNTLEVQVNDGTYFISFYSPQIAETTFIPKGQGFSKKSHAVILDKKIPFKFQDQGSALKLLTEGLSVSVQKQPFKISYSYKEKPVVSEKMGYEKGDLETLSFNLEPDEVLYGGGARALGMNRRGHRLPLYNKAHYGYETYSEQMNYTMPLVISSKKYLIHFDNAPVGYLDLDSKKDNTLTYETILGRKTYQLVVADSWEDLMYSYTDLTGKQPMPPRWVLGNFSSRFGYHSEKETRKTIDEFIKEKIPVDAVIIDIYWFGKDIKGHMGNLEFLKDSFPEPKRMISDFKRKGVKTILVTEPFILTTSKRWEEAVTRNILAKDSIGNPFRFDFYFGNTGLIDLYNEGARKWFWNIYKNLAEIGVAGVWGDLGEPEVHPSELLHETGSADEVHNIYGHDWARLIYEGYKKDFPDQRPFILMRSGFSGSQRFGLIPWSGDVNRSWGGLQSQPEIALQMGMQGLAYMHSDLGGFAGANLDDELYSRWLQYGVFQPVFRPHAQEEVPSEPIFRSKKTKDLARKSIQLRYRLLPYNYNLVFENSQTGMPLMRPLFFENSEKPVFQINSEEYLWGNDFLVAPIVKAGVGEKQITFPEGFWFDFYTDEKIEGGVVKTVATRIDAIPAYVRGGAFIPMAKPMQSTEEYDENTWEVHYYFDNSMHQSERKFYNDDGKTPTAFESGAYEILGFESIRKGKQIKIKMEAVSGSHFKRATKQISLVLHNIKEQPSKIKVGNKRLKLQRDKEKNIVTIPVSWDTRKEKQIRIKFKNKL